MLLFFGFFLPFCTLISELVRSSLLSPYSVHRSHSASHKDGAWVECLALLKRSKLLRLQPIERDGRSRKPKEVISLLSPLTIHPTFLLCVFVSYTARFPTVHIEAAPEDKTEEAGNEDVRLVLCLLRLLLFPYFPSHHYLYYRAIVGGGGQHPPLFCHLGDNSQLKRLRG